MVLPDRYGKQTHMVSLNCGVNAVQPVQSLSFP
jgi:hypothetical protein